MCTISKADILNLRVSERILLAENVWDGIAEMPEEISLSEAHARELDTRLDAYHKNPTEGSPWAMVRERIRTTCD